MNGSTLPPGDDARRPAAPWTEWLAQADSRNGYVREAAVRALGAAAHADALPILLARANDWVPEVRQAACAALDSFLVEAQVVAWGRALGSVAALRRAARADHAALLRKIDDFLAVPAHLSALKHARAALPRSAVRLLLPLELEAAPDEAMRCGVLSQALASTDIAVALDAASKIDRIALADRRLGLAREACLSSYAAVRLAGLRIALQTEPSSPSTQCCARALAFDTAAAVRALALQALREEHGGLIDEAQRRLRDDGSRGRAVALDVLCALHAPDAMALCTALAADRAAAVRCIACAHRFAAADAGERDDLIALALQDPSPRVRRLAVARVRKGAAAPSASALLGMHHAHPRTVSSLVSVAGYLSPWSRLWFLLNLVKGAAGDPELAETLSRDLVRWHVDVRRSFVGPTSEQAGAVTGLWKEVRDGVPSPLRRDLESHLRAFGMLPPSP